MLQSLNVYLLSLDVQLMQYINTTLRSSWLDVVAPVFSLPWLLWSVGAVFFVVWAIKAWRHSERGRHLRLVMAGVVFIAVTLGALDMLVLKVKSTTGRLRPHQGIAEVYHYANDVWLKTAADFVPRRLRGDSFFSAHAAHSMAVAVIAAGLFPPISPYVYAIPLLTGFSRVYLGKHFPSDVVAGWIVGWLMATLALRLARRLARRLNLSDG